MQPNQMYTPAPSPEIDLNKPYVPNEFPTIVADYKLAIIGEAPGEEEQLQLRPFVGRSGTFLSQRLQAAGINRAACYLGNLSNYRPSYSSNNFNLLKPNCPELVIGAKNLKHDLEQFQPNLILLLGAHPLTNAHQLSFVGKDSESVQNWRGSLFTCLKPQSAFFNKKCLGTYHPASIIAHNWSAKPLFDFDLQRALQEARVPNLVPPKRRYEINLSPSELVSRLQHLGTHQATIAIDIEGVVPNITCISIAPSETEAFIVPFTDLGPADEIPVIQELSKLLSNPKVPKILQNGLYDAQALALTYNILVYPILGDTQLAWWELHPELSKSLATQVSVLTDQPYYKDDRKKEDKTTHYNYCCTDSCVTYECHTKELDALDENRRKHYDFNLSLLPPLQYLQVRGINYATDELAALRAPVCDELAATKALLRQDSAQHNMPLFNPKSSAQVIDLLYNKIGFEKRYKKVGGKNTDKLTADEPALLSLYKKYSASHGQRSKILTTILTYRHLAKKLQYLDIGFDSDSRIRCQYNPVGTVTGRLSSSKTLFDTGANLQTIPDEFRSLFRADGNNYFFQCDLKGADGWTVAAWCKALGDPTMMEDYEAGLKPAKIIALLHQIGPEVNKWSRAKLLDECKQVNEKGENGWLYFTCKRVQHATSYGAGATQTSTQILNDSYKKEGKFIHVKPAQCQQLQDLFQHVRYPGIIQYKNRISNIIRDQRGVPELVSASGQTRQFHGRPFDDSTHREALSHEPQANTTYATNLALLNLWNDEDNKNPDGSLIIEPLHQVHDALCGQFPIDKIAPSVAKLKSYFNNTITIAGQEIKIPFDGQYGPTWGHCNEKDLTGEI